ncbi:hypothetical protein [Anaeromyxobacter paludicola]|uniref:NIF system FeS cluster assembly NifU N-terminal domain-containing protein n=1 Tax=Anaeromyxobacter paludicola TaxID=2918171 RepID=A0ABN6N7U9_9BACT|nr:hypothetical protein [Anaeromyxobacter paludicola]BDG08070.1 hypothetical protein AMPC_11830 [Anaeromyxobacter paludicola]
MTAAPTVSELVEGATHGARLEGASRVAAAAGDGRQVRLGVWLDGRGGVSRAGFQSTSCAALIAYAERACQLLERGRHPRELPAEALRDAVRGVHPAHRARAELVARALADLAAPPQPGAEP